MLVTCWISRDFWGSKIDIGFLFLAQLVESSTSLGSEKSKKGVFFRVILCLQGQFVLYFSVHLKRFFSEAVCEFGSRTFLRCGHFSCPAILLQESRCCTENFENEAGIFFFLN